MKRFVIAGLIGLAIGYILMRFSRRRTKQFPEEGEPAETLSSPPAL